LIPATKYVDKMRAFDSSLSPDDRAYAAAVVLLAATERGTSPQDIALESGYPVKFVWPYARAFKKAGIFQGKMVHGSDWDDKKTGSIGFWADVCSGVGKMESGQ
jgi:hypothetical protein